MAQQLSSGRKVAGRPSRGQQMMLHMFNVMDDDSSSFHDHRGIASPSAARALASDERLAMVDFTSAHESRPNNLVSCFLCQLFLPLIYCAVFYFCRQLLTFGKVCVEKY